MTIAEWSLWHGNPANLPEGLTIGLYFPVWIFWFVWWGAAIRCPSCGIRIGWYHMNHGSSRDAVVRISMTQACPACGFSPPRAIRADDEQGVMTRSGPT